MKKKYEVIWEIFNKCSGNQMRDVFFEEVETDDPAQYVANRFKEYTVTDESVADGELVYRIELNGLLQRMSFTEV